MRQRSEGPCGVLGLRAQACRIPACADPGLSLAFSEQRPSFCSHTVAQVTALMAFPHRLDAPELPDFSMLKRLARDQLIYLLEQVSACHAWRFLLRQQCGPPYFPWSFLGRSKMGHSTGKTKE